MSGKVFEEVVISFTPNIPASGQTLGQTRQAILDNFAILRSTLAVDHNDVNVANNGYHKVVHFALQGSDPATIAGIGQLYTKNAGGVPELFYRGNAGVTTQITGPNTPVSATRGYTWLPGGVMLQWGKESTSSSSGTILFATGAVNFPNALFNVQTLGFYNTSTPGSQVTYGVNLNNTFDKTQFSWKRVTNSSDWNGFYWWALGN